MKKNILIALCFICIPHLFFAQAIKTKEVPKEVVNQFKVKNPKAKSITWEKEDENFVALFKDNKNDAKSYFSASGDWMKTMITVDKEDIPTNIFNYAKKTYPTYTDLEEMYFVKQKNEKDYYLVDIVVSSEKIIVNVKFNVTGRYVSHTQREMTQTLAEEKEAKQVNVKEEKVKSKSKTKDEIDDNEDDNDKANKPKEKKVKKGKKAPYVDPYLITEDKVPPVVIKTFKRKFINASEIKWYFNPEDTIYEVTCVVRAEKTQGFIGKSGFWINTLSEMDSKAITSAYLKTIDEFYPEGYTVKTAWREVRADKQDQFIIEIIENAKKRTGEITNIYLDKRGNIIKIAEKESKEEIEESTSKQTDKSESKLEKEFTKDMQMKYKSTNISESELPPGVGLWIMREYPEYFVKKAEYNAYPEIYNKGNIYKVLIERPGVNQPYATGYFTHDGDLLHVVDDFKQETPQEVEKKKRVITNEVLQAFKKQNPKLENEVTWEEGEDDTWVALYQDKELDKKFVYSEPGEWIETRTTINKEPKIPSAIRNYIAKKLPAKKIETCVMVDTPGQKPYYIVTVYDKKLKMANELNFTHTGKLIE